MTWLSLAMDRAMWGLDPFGFHLSNLLLHAINTLMVTVLAGVLLRRTVGEQKEAPVFAATVGLIFALHPLHVESVAWVTERKDLLYAFFWLLSILLWLKQVNRQRSPGLYLASIACFALSVMAKPMAVTLPFVLVLLDFYPLQRISWQKPALAKILLEKMPFFLVAFAGGVVTLATAGSTGALAGTVSLTVIQRIIVACRGAGYYLGLFLAPVHLSPFYPLEVPIDLSLWPYAAGGLAVVGGATLCVALLRRSRLWRTVSSTWHCSHRRLAWELSSALSGCTDRPSGPWPRPCAS